jgi:hypothetical protein
VACHDHSDAQSVAGTKANPRGSLAVPPTLGEILFLPLDHLARLNLGYINLQCSALLPDTQSLDIPGCLKTLHEWTQLVARETDRSMHQFHRSRDDYHNSEAYFRALMMVTVLQLDCGVRYDAEASQRTTFDSSREGFIHGLLTGSKTGTCANLPVLYATVGRQLGYPIYLVGAKGHLFNRWYDSETGERFNIEASGRGMSVLPDEHYLTWPRKITAPEARLGIYLGNLNPTEEVGCFMATRGHCLLDRGHLLDAIVAYSHAHRLAPADPNTLGFLLGALNHELDLQREGRLPVDYRDAETWDTLIQSKRFVLDSKYVQRVAGEPHDEPGRDGHCAPRPER